MEGFTRPYRRRSASGSRTIILVIGKTGQVGTELQRLIPNATFLDRQTLDISQAGNASAAIADTTPDAVINATAYTAVDRAEEEEALAHKVNGEAPGEMAAACAALRVPFVHLSTDYVFNGSGDAAFKPSDATGPLNAYGRSKLLGEQLIKRAGGVFIVLRTSWVFSAHGNNFVKTMLRLAQSRGQLQIVADQVGGPTPAKAIAATCVTLAGALRDAPTKGGFYHFSGAPEVNWAGFAREIFAQAKCDVNVIDIASTEYPTPAKRPANSRLDCHQIEQTFGIMRPDWKVGLREVLAQIENENYAS